MSLMDRLLYQSSQDFPYQDQLIPSQLSGPVGLGAISIQQCLLTVDLIFRLPCGQTLWTTQRLMLQERNKALVCKSIVK